MSDASLRAAKRPSEESNSRPLRHLFTSGRIPAAEVGVAFIALLALGGIAFGPNVVHGGFFNDDLSNVAKFAFAAPGPLAKIDIFVFYSNRPIGLLFFPLTLSVLGTDPGPQLALGIVLGALMVTALYILLRTLGMSRLEAGIVSGLVLIFPAATAPKVWYAGTTSTLAIPMYLVGVVVALRALETTGRRALALHALSLGLYVTSILTYEAAVGAMAFTVGLYLLRTEWRRALVRWLADMIVIVPILVTITAHNFYVRQPIGRQIRQGLEIIKRAAVLVVESVLVTDLPIGARPPSPLLAAVISALLVLTALVSLLLYISLPAGHPTRKRLRRWLWFGGGGVVAIVAGYIPYAASDPLGGTTSPLAPGQFNRINNFSSIGYVILIYSGAMAAAILVTGHTRFLRRSTTVAGVLVAVVFGTVYALSVRNDIDRWVAARSEQNRVLKTIDDLLRARPPGTTIYATGFPNELSPGHPVFAAPWDLDGAIKVRWKDETVAAYPAVPGAALVCSNSAVEARNHFNDRGFPQRAPYGKAYFVDVGVKDAFPMRSKSDCLAAARRYGA